MAQFTPLSQTDHGIHTWTRYSSYDHARGDAVVPVTLQELAQASKTLPLCFTPTGEGYSLAVLQSLLPGQNLCVAPNGQWLTEYTPAIYRAYPFGLGQTETGDHVLCADMDSGLIVEGGEGEPMFDASGPTEAIQSVMNFLLALHKDRAATARVVELLAGHGLIKPWPLTIKTAEGERPVEGIHTLDEAALNALAPDALAEVRDAGGLAVAYCQLLSTRNLATLQQLIKAHTDLQQAKVQPDPEPSDPFADFMKDTGLIQF